MARGPLRRCHLCWQAAHLFTESLNHILVLRLQKASQKWRWGNNYSIVRIIAVYFIMPTQPLLPVLHQKHNILYASKVLYGDAFHIHAMSVILCERMSFISICDY